jgi:hypothetical protein
MGRTTGVIAVAAMALLLVTLAAKGAEPVRIDGSSDAACQTSYLRMRASLDTQERMRLDIAIFKLNMAGAASASEAPAHPSAVHIKNTIAGLTAGQIIALGEQVKGERFVTSDQAPGIPADLMAPLPTGPVTTPIGGAVWHVTSNTSGHAAQDTMTLASDGTVRIIRTGAKSRDAFDSNPGGPVAGTYVVRDENGSVRDLRTGTDVGHGTWKQSADTVRISLNHGFAVLVGHLTGNGRMAGKGGNRFGVTWTWEAVRK